jgi:uncharacterized protein DUF2783
MVLNLDPNMQDGDGFYDRLLTAHHNLDKAQSDAFNARLILILANHIGDSETLNEALKAAAE